MFRSPDGKPQYKLIVETPGDIFTEWFRSFKKAVDYGLWYESRYAARTQIIDRKSGRGYFPPEHR